MKKRNTIQKQIILDTLRNDRTHPTMSELYEKVSQKYPKIGQATVYRNVNDLAQSNTIEKIVDTAGNFHYDGNPKKHIHLIPHHLLFLKILYRHLAIYPLFDYLINEYLHQLLVYFFQ